MFFTHFLIAIFWIKTNAVKHKMYKVINESKTTKTILSFFLIEYSFIQHFIQTMNVQRKQMVLLYLQGYQKDFYGYQKHSISIRMICMKDEKKIGWYIFWNIILLFHKENWILFIKAIHIMKFFSAVAAIFKKKVFFSLKTWKNCPEKLLIFFQFHEYLMKS